MQARKHQNRVLLWLIDTTIMQRRCSGRHHGATAGTMCSKAHRPHYHAVPQRQAPPHLHPWAKLPLLDGYAVGHVSRTRPCLFCSWRRDRHQAEPTDTNVASLGIAQQSAMVIRCGSHSTSAPMIDRLSDTSFPNAHVISASSCTAATSTAVMMPYIDAARLANC